MKLYNDLSCIGQLRRLRTLAAAVLAQYDLNSPEIAYYCFGTNLLYRVTEASGERYILRLASPGWRTYEDLQSEALWLKALEQDTDIPAPRVIPRRSGEYVLPMKMASISRVWNATLMSWVPGRLLGGYLTQRNLEKMGELFAKLHLHGAEWKPPAGFTTRKFEHWLSRGEPNLIIAESGAVAKELRTDAGEALSSEAVDLLERIHRQVEAAYAAIDRSDLRVISL